MKDVPIKDTAKSNTKVIIIVLTLLAFLILMTLIVFYFMYVRSRNFKKQGNSHCSIHFFTIKHYSRGADDCLRSLFAPTKYFIWIICSRPISVDCNCCLAIYSTHQHWRWKYAYGPHQKGVWFVYRRLICRVGGKFCERLPRFRDWKRMLPLRATDDKMRAVFVEFLSSLKILWIVMVVRLFLVVVKLIRSKYISCSKILELFHILAIRVAMLFFASDCFFVVVVVFFLLVCLFFVCLLLFFFIKYLHNYCLGHCRFLEHHHE